MPKIVDCERSFFTAKGMRHPIVEIISDLPEGTKVVDQGKTSVSKGQTVKVISS